MTDKGFQVLDAMAPVLESGEYEISVHHRLAAPAIEHDGSATPATATFRVGGGSIALAPDDLVACHPPANSVIAEPRWYASVELQRATLPWERSPLAGDPPVAAPVPWLAVALVRPATATIDKSSPVPTITLPATALPRDLATLSARCHVRVAASGDEHAFVVSNDWVHDGGRWEAHLVSVEGAYRERSLISEGPKQFPLLHSWAFEVGDADFGDLVEALDQSALRVPAEGGGADGTEPIGQGYVPLKHGLRDGSRTYSWYRGPLVSAGLAVTPVAEIEARHADHLLRADDTTGLIDVSLAAAFELGRLLTLRNEAVAVALHRWKRSWHRQAVEDPMHAEFRNTSLPPVLAAKAALADVAPVVPDSVRVWFDELRTLLHVPFHHLVPDERMLPPDSIRFFHVDAMWVGAMLHGAASIGGSPTIDAEQYSTDLDDLRRVPPTAGMLVRAGIVSDHPSLSVSGEPFVARRLLSPDLLLVLFDSTQGAPASVDLHLAPEAIHLAEPVSPPGVTDPASGAEFARARVSSGTTVRLMSGLV